MDVIVIGGSGTIGRAVMAAVAGRYRLVNCARTSGEEVVDITSTDSLRRLFSRLGTVDAVVCVAGDAVFKPLAEITDADYTFGLGSKLLGQVNVVRTGLDHVRDGGSFTLTAGVTSRRPIPASSAYSMINAAIEGFVRGAALDLPRGIRINAVSPQWVDTSLVAYGMDPAWGVPADRVAEATSRASRVTGRGTSSTRAGRTTRRRARSRSASRSQRVPERAHEPFYRVVRFFPGPTSGRR